MKTRTQKIITFPLKLTESESALLRDAAFSRGISIQKMVLAASINNANRTMGSVPDGKK
jgi:uncharacterized protein (DUF1778 family)